MTVRFPLALGCTWRHDQRVVTEYLIRTSETQEWPAFDRGRVREVLTPRGFECSATKGWGDYRLRCENAEVAYSGEERGWQVTVEGDLPNADRFIAQVTAQVADAAGEPCEWLRLT